MSRPVALVTGASAGIGADLARLYADAGFDLVLVARRRARLETLAESLPVHCLVVDADLAVSEGPARVYEAVTQAGLQVEELVCSAGLGSYGRFVELPLDRELEQVRVNVEALVALCRRFAPAMVERGHGRILNLASLASFQAGPGMATYCATKAFVLSFSEALAEELRGTGVTVTAHCPGP
ncbi:MAG: SDR family NAD(P)-dependent oxidoreductase, partial [Myxococcota bacterium]